MMSTISVLSRFCIAEQSGEAFVTYCIFPVLQRLRGILRSSRRDPLHPGVPAFIFPQFCKEH